MFCGHEQECGEREEEKRSVRIIMNHYSHEDDQRFLQRTVLPKAMKRSTPLLFYETKAIMHTAVLKNEKRWVLVVFCTCDW